MEGAEFRQIIPFQGRACVVVGEGKLENTVRKENFTRGEHMEPRWRNVLYEFLLAILRAYFLNLRKCGKARAIGVYSNSERTSYASRKGSEKEQKFVGWRTKNTSVGRSFYKINWGRTQKPRCRKVLYFAIGPRYLTTWCRPVLL